MRSHLFAAIYCTLVFTIGAVCIHGPAAAQSPTGQTVLPRIKVAEDGGSFVTSADPSISFRPWGFNYLGKFDSLAEEDWLTTEGWERIEQDFRQMKSLGANVVRWHLQLATFMTGPTETNPEQLLRLRQLLDLARAHSLYLDLTGLNCYRLEAIPTWFDALSESQRWAVQAHFWSAIAKTCADHSAVFCYDLMNEPIVGAAKSGEHPWVTGELGGFHFVQRICNAPEQRTSQDIAAAWVELMVNAIRQHDDVSLITVGVIPWAFVWETAQPVFYSPSALAHLDFVSVHVYPEHDRIDKDIRALATYDLGKPLVIEEIFPLKCSIQELDQFIDATSNRADGWIAHYFGYTPAEHRAGAKPAIAVADFLEFWQHKKTKP